MKEIHPGYMKGKDYPEKNNVLFKALVEFDAM